MMVKEKNGEAEKQGIIARNHKKLHITAISVMCLLILLCIKLSVDYKILRDVYATANTLIDIVLMAFLTMLFGFSAVDKYSGSKQNIVFSLLIVVDFSRS